MPIFHKTNSSKKLTLFLLSTLLIVVIFVYSSTRFLHITNLSNQDRVSEMEESFLPLVKKYEIVYYELACGTVYYNKGKFQKIVSSEKRCEPRYSFTDVEGKKLDVLEVSLSTLETKSPENETENLLKDLEKSGKKSYLKSFSCGIGYNQEHCNENDSKSFNFDCLFCSRLEYHFTEPKSNPSDTVYTSIKGKDSWYTTLDDFPG